MEITSSEANPQTTASSSNTASSYTIDLSSTIDDCLGENPASSALVIGSGKSLDLVTRTNNLLVKDHALAEDLAGLRLSHTRQKGDCLYLYCQDTQELDSQTGLPIAILEAIAPSTQDVDSSILFREGIRRLKLHGKAWALGVDLPIAPSAMVAAKIIEALLINFRQEAKLAQTNLKLLLQSNCLNLLCETSIEISQAEMALPILNTLRTVRPSEYFQSVTVSGRVIGCKKPSWSFEIDLLAIGIEPEVQEQPRHYRSVEFLSEQKNNYEDRDYEKELSSWERLGVAISDRLASLLIPLIQLKWLGQVSPNQKFPNQQISEQIALPICIASLAIGFGGAIAIDRTLNHYAQPDEFLKFAIAADSKIDLQESRITTKPALNFNIALFNEKLALIDWQITNKQRSPEVLIVGSSRALRGVEPTTLEKSLVAKGYKGIGVFNLGIDGATAKVVDIQLTQILSKPQLPRIIIWADGLRAFNSVRSDLTYDEITASTGYKQLQETLKLQGLNPNSLATNPNTAPKSASSLSIPLTQAIDLLFTTSSKRQEIRTSLVKSFDRNTHMLSNSEALIAATMPNTVTALDRKGFVSFDVIFDPKTYFQKFPQVSGDYDIDYRSFDTNGSQFEAFANVVNFCRSNNIELVVVNMPLHATYLDVIRSRYEATFNRRMEELSRREGFTFLDLTQTISNQAELFSDPSHLNKQGAIAIAKMLAENPRIRWKSLKP